MWIPGEKRAEGVSELHGDSTGLNTKNWNWQEVRLKRKTTDDEKACLCSSNALPAGNGKGRRVT